MGQRTVEQSPEQCLQDIFNFADTNDFIPLFASKQLWRSESVPVNVALLVGVNRETCSVILKYNPDGEKPHTVAKPYKCHDVWPVLLDVANKGELMPKRDDDNPDFWEALSRVVGYKAPTP